MLTTERAEAPRPTIPAPLLVLLAVSSLQVGAAVAKGLFDEVGAPGTVWLRVGVAAIILLALQRPRLGGYSRAAYTTGIGFGLALGAMNLTFYASLERIPLGVAVTLEFIGPLGLAVAQSRRAPDFFWAALAAGGIVLLGPVGIARGDLDPTGVALALAAGGFWAAYILLTARTGRAFPRGEGLVIALVTASVAIAPLGVASGGTAFFRPEVIAGGVALGILSSALPYSLELAALRRMPTRVFGILMATEPAIAAVVGWLALGEPVSARMLAAIALVMAASIGVTRRQRPPLIAE